MTAPEPTSTTDNPKLTAEEIGKRFLKLIEGMGSRNDLSIERVQEATGLSLDRSPPSPGGTVFQTYTQPLEGGWEYAFRHISDSRSNPKGVDLLFINRANENADMAPACSLDFDYYHNALVAMGFLAEPHYGEIGELRSWRYTKFKKSDGTVEMTISIIPQNIVSGEAGRLCVKSIGTLN